MYRILLSALLVAAPLAVSAHTPTDSMVFPTAASQADRPVPGFGGGNDVRRCGITDMAAFDAYVATRPTPVEFRSRYSCLTLVLPGDMTTRELRMDNSRYFADLDAHGRIQGGSFR